MIVIALDPSLFSFFLWCIIFEGWERGERGWGKGGKGEEGKGVEGGD